MFEAFGFTQERLLQCRKSTQLPSDADCAWWSSSALLIPFFIHVYASDTNTDMCSISRFWQRYWTRPAVFDKLQSDLFQFNEILVLQNQILYCDFVKGRQ